MLKKILRLEGVVTLSREQQKSVNGGALSSICKATCKDGSLVTVSGCSDSAMACSTAGGSSSCNCDYPDPLAPPKLNRDLVF